MDRPRIAILEIALLCAAILLSLVLGFAHLGVPSLWHDEALYVFVGKSLIETGWPALPSGVTYTNGIVFSTILAGTMALFGDGEAAVRAPSVIFAAIAILLVYALVRRLPGRPAALVTALMLAVSPWSVAWAREVRPYNLQLVLYLATAWCVWAYGTATRRRSLLLHAAAACAAFFLAVHSVLHSVLFLAPVGVFALVMALREKRWRSRWTALCCGVIVVGVLTILMFRFLLPAMEQDMVFNRTSLGGKMVDPDRADRLYYFRWLWLNLSSGYFILAMLGSGLMLLKEKRRGLYAAALFWAPVLFLTFLVGYRQPRFMYFTFPFYIAAFSFALVELARFLAGARRSKARTVVSVLIILFLARLAWSTVKLCGDSIETAAGAPITLAHSHPQWREPCRYVRERLSHDAVVVTTTYLPVLYYVGRVDTWFPSRVLWWEQRESGLEGLRGPDDLDAYMRENPRGFYLAEWSRLEFLPVTADDLAFVKGRMTYIPEASSKDVSVYSWGLSEGETPHNP